MAKFSPTLGGDVWTKFNRRTDGQKDILVSPPEKNLVARGGRLMSNIVHSVMK
jgi:hypothetical protein